MAVLQASQKDMSSKDQNYNRNPEGKGGFADNPQNRANGRWRKEDSVSYWMNRFLRMSINDMKQWEKENKNDDRTFAQRIAYNSVMKSISQLKYQIETTDRTEGRAKQYIENRNIEEKPIFNIKPKK